MDSSHFKTKATAAHIAEFAQILTDRGYTGLEVSDKVRVPEIAEKLYPEFHLRKLLTDYVDQRQAKNEPIGPLFLGGITSPRVADNDVHGPADVTHCQFVADYTKGGFTVKSIQVTRGWGDLEDRKINSIVNTPVKGNEFIPQAKDVSKLQSNLTGLNLGYNTPNTRSNIAIGDFAKHTEALCKVLQRKGFDGNFIVNASHPDAIGNLLQTHLKQFPEGTTHIPDFYASTCSKRIGEAGYVVCDFRIQYDPSNGFKITEVDIDRKRANQSMETVMVKPIFNNDIPSKQQCNRKVMRTLNQGRKL